MGQEGKFFNFTTHFRRHFIYCFPYWDLFLFCLFSYLVCCIFFILKSFHVTYYVTEGKQVTIPIPAWQRHSLNAGIPTPQKSGRFSWGGGERVTHWVVDCRPHLVKTIGNCKPTPPKHTHRCFMWWHSIQCDRHSENSAVRTIHKSETLLNFLLGPLWLLLLAESLYVAWWWSFLFPREDCYKKTHRNQPVYPDFLVLCSQNPVQVSWVKTRKPHSIYL